ncbi:MAG: divergent polysaccharide deacetylase family protein [Pseudomonadota bacterium]
MSSQPTRASHFLKTLPARLQAVTGPAVRFAGTLAPHPGRWMPPPGRPRRLVLAILAVGAAIGVLLPVGIFYGRAQPDKHSVVLYLDETAAANTGKVADSAAGPLAQLYNDIVAFFDRDGTANTAPDSVDGQTDIIADTTQGPQADAPLTAEPAELPLDSARDEAAQRPPQTGEPEADTPAPATTLVTTQEATPLRPAPVQDLVEPSAHGLLPRIGPDGRRPAEVYARPFNNPKQMPVIAVVIGQLGLSRSAAAMAVSELPPEITLAFLPYGDGLQGVVNSARAEGHEVLVHLPLEPFNYPDNDPGPLTLLSQLSEAENLDRLHGVMGSFSGFSGLMAHEGAKLKTMPKKLLPILTDIGERGLFIVDDSLVRQNTIVALAQQLELDTLRSDEMIDFRPTRTDIDKMLTELEEVARARGFSVGIGNALPVTVEQVATWAEGLNERGILLAPMSAVVALASAQADRQAAVSPKPATPSSGAQSPGTLGLDAPGPIETE